MRTFLIILNIILLCVVIFLGINFMKDKKAAETIVAPPVSESSTIEDIVVSSSDETSSSEISSSSEEEVEFVVPEYDIPVLEGKYTKADFDARQKQSGNSVPSDEDFYKAKAKSDLHLKEMGLDFNPDNTWWVGYQFTGGAWKFNYLTTVGGKYGQFNFDVTVSIDYVTATSNYDQMLKQNS